MKKSIIMAAVAIVLAAYTPEAQAVRELTIKK